jgi:DNA-binding response OmpR family regulator
MQEEHRNEGPVVSLLIADDDEKLRVSLGSAFEPMGFTVYLAAGGTRAVKLAQENAIDIAILDVNMPDLNGIEAMRRIRRARRSVACIFITSESSSAVRSRVRSLEAYTIVRKPIRLESLRCAVMKLLEKRGGDTHLHPGVRPHDSHVAQKQ